MTVRRTKPYVCVDVDYAEHFRFQNTDDVDAAAGTWLRCLSHSRAQEQDGVVKLPWLRRTFATTYGRVEDLIRVGLLRPREDGDFEIHAYAPRNQTHAMIEDERQSARERMRARRAAAPKPMVRRTNPNALRDRASSHEPALISPEGGTNRSSHTEASGPSLPPSEPLFAPRVSLAEKLNNPGPFGAIGREKMPVSSVNVTPNGERQNSENAANERRTSARVPTSTSSLSPSLVSSDLFPDAEISSGDLTAVPRRAADTRAPTRDERPSLPPSERSLSGAFWLASFSDGIREQTGRPCTVGRVYLGTLERIVTHHAPQRDAAGASAWLKAQAKAFAALWDGKHPAKGLTPDGLERWLNEGRQGPPVFGRPRIVQPAAAEWHEDDWSDLGAKVGP